MAENSDFMTNSSFFGTFELQQRYKSVRRTHSRANFYADFESGVKNCVLALKQGQNLRKIVYFLPILALKSAFLTFSTRNNDKIAYVERNLGQIFTLIPNQGSKTVLAFKRGQKLQKMVYFLPILAHVNKMLRTDNMLQSGLAHFHND